MTTRLTAVVSAVALTVPVTSAAGTLATPKRKVVTQWKQARGTAVQVDRWGEIQVVLVIRKRIVSTGTKKTVSRRITGVRLPVWPNDGGAHTVNLNRRVLPLLSQQVLKRQFATKIQVISEATDTSTGFEQSLQVALANGRRI